MGDLRYAKQYTGISLLVIGSKISSKMLELRIRPYAQPILRNKQNSFRPSRANLSHILALRRMLEGVGNENLQAVTSADFSKTLYSIYQGKVMQICKACGIPGIIVNEIRVLYNSQQKGTHFI